MDINEEKFEVAQNETTMEENHSQDLAQSDDAGQVDESARTESLEGTAAQNLDEQPAAPMSAEENSSSVDSGDAPVNEDTVTAPAAMDAEDEAAGDKGGTLDADPATGPTLPGNMEQVEEPSAPVSMPEKETGSDLQNTASGASRTPANAQMVSEVVLSILRGITDEDGTEESKANAQAKCNIFRQAVKKTVEGMKTLEEKKQYVERMDGVSQPLEIKAKIFIAFSNVVRGEAVNAMKKGIKHGEFLPYLHRTFTKQKVRRMQESMSIAGINGVERHLNLGVTELLLFPPIIKKYGLGNDQDPIQTILDQTKNYTGFLNEGYETLARIAIASFKLKKAGLIIDPVALHKFISAGFELKSGDIKEMKAMQKNQQEAQERGEDASDPSIFLLDVVENAGTRVFALTQSPGQEAELPTSPAIRDINSTLVSTADTLSQALSLPEISMGDVDRAVVRNLMEVLKKFDEALGRA